jgi:prevent-host-death family protein
MRSVHASYVKAHFAEVIATVRRGAEPLLVTQNGASAVVIQDHEAFGRMRKALLLLKLVALGEREVAAHGTMPHKRVFGTLRSRRKARSKRK